ncbi:MAG: molybdopterin molybdotransferase MoeA [Verrucomicrobiota bacterium]
MISLAEARALIQASIRPLAAQSVALAGAHGRVLREDLRANEDMPAFDRSAMDGYAVALDDGSKQFRVVGEIQPGVAPAFKINHSEAARIFTGAQIPEGASQVIMQEDVRVEGNLITPTQRNRTPHIRKRGEDARKGDLLLKSGARLGAGELALLASLGLVEPKVSPLVRVVHFTTGNELVAPSDAPKPGQIRDSNSALITALVDTYGGEIAQQERVADDFDLLLQRAADSLSAEPTRKENESSAGWKPPARIDLLLVSGGASVGDYDFGKKLLGALGFQIHFEKINLRPGKPLIFATRGNQAAFILPGNPVSHFVTFHVAVRLALEKIVAQASSLCVPDANAETHRLEACATMNLPLAKIRLAEKVEYRPDPRETFWPARVTIENGGLVARALRWQSSGDVNALAGANALLQFTGATQTLAAGSDVNALLLDVP